MKIDKRPIVGCALAALCLLAAAAAAPRSAVAQNESGYYDYTPPPPPDNVYTSTPPAVVYPAPAPVNPPPAQVYYSTPPVQTVYVNPPPSPAEEVGPRGGFSIGPRAMWYHPLDANSSSWSGGAQGRIHLGPIFAIEGSVDYRQHKFSGVTTDVYPVQVTGLLYFLPHFRISPYALGGVGWYYTHFRDPVNETQHRWGPHVGGGLEAFLTRNWSVDADFRYLWNNRLKSSNPPFTDQTFRDRGQMVTIGVNYWF